MQTTTDPDFPAPRPPMQTPPDHGPDATFTAVDLVTPWRSSVTSFEDARAQAVDARFHDDVIILVHVGGRLVDALTTDGVSVHAHRERNTSQGNPFEAAPRK